MTTHYSFAFPNYVTLSQPGGTRNNSVIYLQQMKYKQEGVDESRV